MGLPGYDCGLCGFPSCSSAARHMELGKRDVRCPFSRPSIGPAWIARPAKLRVVRPCPSRPTLAELVISLAPEDARFRPLDHEAASLTLPALGLRTRTALRGQMVIGETAELRVNVFITGKVSVRSELGEEAARDILPRLLRCLAAASVCQETGLAELEVAAGWAGAGHELLCSYPRHYMRLAGLELRGLPAGKAAADRPDLVEAFRAMASLEDADVDEAARLGAEALAEGELLGLWLLGAAVEVRRALKNDPDRSSCQALSQVLAGRAVDVGSLQEMARSSERRVARPAMAALKLSSAWEVIV